MNIKEMETLKNQFFKDDELNKFLKSLTSRLLISKVKNQTLSPVLLTHKEFIDISLPRILKPIKEKIFAIAKQQNLLGDKIFEMKLEYLSAYILKYDMAKEMVIHKTIAKYILNLVRKEALKLNHFVSTLKRDTYSGKFGKFRYPPLYPYDRNRYNNPIPEIKAILNKIDTVKKGLNTKEAHLNTLQNNLDKTNLGVEQIKTTATDMKDIVTTLKHKYKDDELKIRLAMIKNQHSRFNVLLTEYKNNITTYTKEIKTLSKNIQATKEKYKDTLDKEDKLIDTLATNLKTMKVKI